MIQICIDDLSDGRIVALLEQHRQEMFKHSPPESVHALDKTQMLDPSLTFFSAYVDQNFAACGALKRHSQALVEIKSMKTKKQYLRQGVARHLLEHLLQIARLQGHQQVALETGSMHAFMPARALYRKFGFEVCSPFADYQPDPHSVCMSLDL